LNAGASFAPPRFVTVFNAPAAELEEAVGGVWNSLADRTEETNAINAAAARKTTYDAAKAALVTAQTALATANTAFTASKTAYATKATAYDVAKAAAKVLNDANQVLVDAYNVIVAKTAASDARINNLDAFILLLNGWIDEDPQTTSMDQAIADAELAQDNIDPLAPGTKQLLAAAEDDVVTATADLEAAKTELTAVIASYKMDLPLDQNGVVYLTTQIADKTAEIANLTSILAQQKAVVDMWLAKITAALTAI
jgi:3D (Asp-Asp-Asp) domain-containing protein